MCSRCSLRDLDQPAAFAADACNKRMLGYRGPAQPSPTLGDALNAGYLYLEVRCIIGGVGRDFMLRFWGRICRQRTCIFVTSSLGMGRWRAIERCQFAR